MSADWESAPLVYDFGGFAPRFFAMTYPMPDASGLAVSVGALLPGGEQVHQHLRRGLDHGAQGDVPGRRRAGAAAQLPSHDPDRLIRSGRGCGRCASRAG